MKVGDEEDGISELALQSLHGHYNRHSDVGLFSRVMSRSEMMKGTQGNYLSGIFQTANPFQSVTDRISYQS
jgi:hypothetical protein